jgi:hypothetical protein
MEQLLKQLKDSSEAPGFISRKVMRRIILYRLRAPLALSGLFLGSFGYLSYRIYECVMNTGALVVLQAIISDFEMSWSYIAESAEGFIETMPMTEIRLLVVNFTVMVLLSVYFYVFYKNNRKFSTN